MTESPDTRLSLIVRLRDLADQEAWREFVEIYRPVVYRMARLKHLQHADAEDLAQQVMSAVAKAIDRWEPDATRGRFRTWLRRIAENLIVNALTRRVSDRASGEEAERERLSREAAPDGPDSELLRAESRRELFGWAARQIRAEFQTETWEAFWDTAVEGRDVKSVARMSGKTVGAVYAARSRVMRRLKEKVLEWEEAE
jgi:RNA polymerase sigma factor (sigma-70 family)